jgi:hypothetical protein
VRRSSSLGVTSAVLATAVGCTAPDDAPTEPQQASLGFHTKPKLTKIGSFQGDGGFDEAAATIVAFDHWHDELFVTNLAMQRIDVIDLSQPSAPVLSHTIDVTPYGHHANSVAVSPYGFVAAAIEADDPQAPGKLAFFTHHGAPLGSVTVGALPDMVTFTPNGRHALVANEGEPDDDHLVDPEGSISIVDLRWGPWKISQSKVETANFHAFDQAPLDASLRVTSPGATLSQDLEPEYIAVSANSKKAWVTLQENNGLALIDIDSAQVEALYGLGFKDHDQVGAGLDASDRDDAINIAPWPLRGMYQPDGVAAFRRFGKTYLVTANEGDARDRDGFSEVKRAKSLTLDPTAFPNASALQADAAMGRLDCSTVDGDEDQDGDHDALYSFGTRSFSIWSSDGAQLFDSGDALEQITAAANPAAFNSNNDDNDSFDGRSDNAGPEPEGLAIGAHHGRTYAFIGLERVGGIVVYDVTKPWAPSFIQYLNTRDFAGDPEAGTAGDLGPEGLVFIPAWQSPSHKALLVVAYEISGTTAIYQFQ